MKTFVAISLSIIVFSQSVGIGISDVFKLSDLVEHVKYHAKEYGDDYSTFFEKHYGFLKTEHQQSKSHNDSPHEKLPFQHNNCNHLLPEVVVVAYDFMIEKAGVATETKPDFYYQNPYSFLERVSIFQPPRTA